MEIHEESGIHPTAGNPAIIATTKYNGSKQAPKANCKILTDETKPNKFEKKQT